MKSNYLFKRLITFIPIIIGMTFLAFLVMQLAPGIPVDMYLDPSIEAVDIARLKMNLGLEKPIIIQYFYWLKNIIQGNFGFSYITGKPVLTSILERLPATLLLSISSLILILIITFPLGIISGAKENSWFDHLITIGVFIGLSIPTFWLGLMLILFFSLKLNILPTSGFINPNLYQSSIWIKTIDIFKHLLLPLLTILIGGLATLTRYHRFGTISILNEDYIRAARARGISEKVILFKHVFKNAVLPIITILGLSLPGLIGGSFIIEYIFSWPGMGQLGISAIFARDYPILMGTILFSSILIILGNLFADIAYALVDPRIRKK
jgi:peptide/nickel transport system permease protein